MIRRIARSFYLRYQLKKMLANGLPSKLATPLLYLVGQNKLTAEDRAVVEKIESIRTNIAEKGEEQIQSYYTPPPGSAGNELSETLRITPGEVNIVSMERIAYGTSIPRDWGTFLYLCANATQAKTILELGSCAGISGAYMAAGQYCQQFITIEGSPPLSKLAESSIGQVTENFTVVNAIFDDGLDRVIPTLNNGLDMVWIDGHHEKIATIHYFQRLIPYLNEGCLVLFDDTSWSHDMQEAWEKLAHWDGFSHAVDLVKCGLCIWDGNVKKPSKVWDFPIYPKKIGVPRGWLKLYNFKEQKKT